MTSVLRAISTSDWHLQAYERYFPDGSALDRQMNEIKKPYVYAREQGIEHVFMPGDLSDVPRMDERYLIALIAFFKSVDDHITTHYIIGNHDHLKVGRTSIDVLNSLVNHGFLKRLKLYYQPKRIKIEGVPVTFMPFPHTKQPKDRPSLVFAHVETAGAIGDNGHPVRSSGKHNIVRVDGDYMISGHLHTRQYIKSSRTLFNGSLTQRNFGEALPKGWVEFTAQLKGGKMRVDHEFVTNTPEFTFTTVTISDKSQWEDLSTDPARLYRVFVDDGIVVPRNLMRDQSNIIYVYGSDKKKKIQAQDDHAAEKSLQDLPKIGPTTFLKPFLKKLGFSSSEMRLAKEMVAEARSELSM